MITEQRANKIKSVYSKRQKDLVVVLENVWDPHNVSAVLRSCDSVGVDSVYLIYPDGKFPKLADSSSASAFKWINIKKYTEVTECYKDLKKNKFKIYTTHLGEGVKSVELYKMDLTKKVALVFGNEHAGLTEEALKKSDGNFWIPMVGMVQSLNISVSVAVTVYEAMRQRIMAGKYDKSQYSKKEIDQIVHDVAWEKINRRLKKS
jgi:tRNA (guanosine-2'-O-)-methyltransferase